MVTQKISYGPHLFPDDPEYHIRMGPNGIREHGHVNVAKTLAMAFIETRPDSIISQLTRNPNPSVNLSFMNYGNTELVYLATIDDTEKVAVLVNQPHTPLGVVREEFENLQRLHKIDPRFVVKPLAFFKHGSHELYASEYVEDAFCIGHLNRMPGMHGVYNPLPDYHFETFSPEVSNQVNANMISLLVNYYDEDKQRGLAKTQISGNDFLLTRNANIADASTIAPNMKLISARGMVETTLEGYLDMLRDEFLVGTTRDDTEVRSGKMRVNHHSIEPMTKDQIERGIGLGLELRKK